MALGRLRRVHKHSHGVRAQFADICEEPVFLLHLLNCVELYMFICIHINLYGIVFIYIDLDPMRAPWDPWAL